MNEMTRKREVRRELERKVRVVRIVGPTKSREAVKISK